MVMISSHELTEMEDEMGRLDSQNVRLRSEITSLRAELAMKDAEIENNRHAYADNMFAMAAELAATSKDAARWDWIMSNYYNGDLTRTQKVIGSCFSRSAMEAAIDNDMGEGNGR